MRYKTNMPKIPIREGGCFSKLAHYFQEYMPHAITTNSDSLSPHLQAQSPHCQLQPPGDLRDVAFHITDCRCIHQLHLLHRQPRPPPSDPRVSQAQALRMQLMKSDAIDDQCPALLLCSAECHASIAWML